jgi:probable F420-dependent oxidoreductase
VTERPIRIGVQLWPQHADYREIRDACVRAEELGVDAVYTWDHFFPALGADTSGKHFECWTLLAAMAEATERVELGSLVTGTGYRNPNLLADMARTVDLISGGRLVLGIGAGWFKKDYDEYGYEFGTAASRLAALERDLVTIKERFPLLNPPPMRQIPILIGAGGERVALRIVAQHADIWNGGFGDPEVVSHKSRVLDDWCRELGRDPAEIERSTNLRAEALERVDELVEVGVRHVIVGRDGPAYDLAPLRELVAWRDARAQAHPPST